jgi:hypothetical protein
MDKTQLAKINFIFYIPGSAGSLLSILMKSQIDKNFQFNGFATNNAHSYCIDAIADTHTWHEYQNFKKMNISLEEYFKDKNLRDSLFQRCDVSWLDEFTKMKNLNLILCYIGDYNIKLFNLYKKEYNTINEVVTKENNIKVPKTHKDYETIFFIKSLNVAIQIENKHMDKINSINILPVLKKDYKQFSKICKITNHSLLDKIINDYNARNIIDFDILPKSMNRYLQKHHNSIQYTHG